MKTSEAHSRRVTRLWAAAFKKWYEELGSEPCGWCGLQEREHIPGPRGLGHSWISVEMDILLHSSIWRYSKEPIRWQAATSLEAQP